MVINNYFSHAFKILIPVNIFSDSVFSIYYPIFPDQKPCQSFPFTSLMPIRSNLICLFCLFLFLGFLIFLTCLDFWHSTYRFRRYFYSVGLLITSKKYKWRLFTFWINILLEQAIVFVYFGDKFKIFNATRPTNSLIFRNFLILRRIQCFEPLTTYILSKITLYRWKVS